MAASVAGPVVHAVTDLIDAVLIAVAVVVGLARTAGATLVAWRLRHWVPHGAPLVPRPRRVHHREAVTSRRGPAALPAADRPAIERPSEIHLHLHGVSAEDVAAIIARQGIPGAGEQ